MDREAGAVRRWLPLRLALIALVAVVGLLMVLVLRPTTPVVLETRPGLPDGVERADLDDGPGWVLDAPRRRIEIYTAGSSSCPTVPRAVRTEGSTVTVTLAPVTRAACTEDVAWTTTVIAVPDAVTDLDALEVELVTR